MAENRTPDGYCLRPAPTWRRWLADLPSPPTRSGTSLVRFEQQLLRAMVDAPDWSELVPWERGQVRRALRERYQELHIAIEEDADASLREAIAGVAAAAAAWLLPGYEALSLSFDAALGVWAWKRSRDRYRRQTIAQRIKDILAALDRQVDAG